MSIHRAHLRKQKMWMHVVPRVKSFLLSQVFHLPSKMFLRKKVFQLPQDQRFCRDGFLPMTQLLSANLKTLALSLWVRQIWMNLQWVHRQRILVTVPHLIHGISLAHQVAHQVDQLLRYLHLKHLLQSVLILVDLSANLQRLPESLEFAPHTAQSHALV